MSDDNLISIFAPPILTLIFSGICYSWARAARRGKPVTRLQRAMIIYATTFVFGMAYAILLQDKLGELLHWRKSWIAAIGLWAALLGLVAWRNFAVQHCDEPPRK